MNVWFRMTGDCSVMPNYRDVFALAGNSFERQLPESCARFILQRFKQSLVRSLIFYQ